MRPARRRLLSVMAAAGLLAACALSLSGGSAGAEPDIQAGQDGHGTAMVHVGRDGRCTTTGAGTSFSAALIAGAAAYPVRGSAPDAVLASFTAWLAAPGGQVAAARYGLGGPDPAAEPRPSPAGITLEEIVVTGVATVCAFVAALVFVLRMSARRRDRRPAAMTAPPHDRMPGGWEEKSWSFGPGEGPGDGGTPGYGRPPGYRPPPLWTESPYDPPAWR